MHDPRISAIPDIHGHVKGEHRPYAEERPIPYTARMLFLWFYHACVRGAPRFLMASDHVNLLTFEDPSAVNLVRRALKLAQAGDLYGAAETANVEVQHAAAVSEGLRRRNMRYSIGAEFDNDPRCRPDAANIVDAMRPDGIIRAVHFIPIDHPTHGPNWQWAFDYPEFTSLYDHVGTETLWKLYTAALYSAIETQPCQVVAHFYRPALFGHWPDLATLEGYEDRLLEICKERGLAIELNSRVFYKSEDQDQIRNVRDAYLRLLKKSKVADVAIAVGADAHSPRDQGGGFEMVLELLDAADINELAFPIAGRLARVALKVVREPERVPAVAAASANGSAQTAAGAKDSKRRKAPAKAAQGADLPPAIEPLPDGDTAVVPVKRAPPRRVKAGSAVPDVSPVQTPAGTEPAAAAQPDIVATVAAGAKKIAGTVAAAIPALLKPKASKKAGTPEKAAETTGASKTPAVAAKTAETRAKAASPPKAAAAPVPKTAAAAAKAEPGRSKGAVAATKVAAPKVAAPPKTALAAPKAASKAPVSTAATRARPAPAAALKAAATKQTARKPVAAKGAGGVKAASVRAAGAKSAPAKPARPMKGPAKAVPPKAKTAVKAAPPKGKPAVKKPARATAKPKAPARTVAPKAAAKKSSSKSISSAGARKGPVASRKAPALKKRAKPRR